MSECEAVSGFQSHKVSEERIFIQYETETEVRNDVRIRGKNKPAGIVHNSGNMRKVWERCVCVAGVSRERVQVSILS